MYEIQSKSDFKVGATLIVRIPEEELDQKALYTMLADKPDFILPFNHRVIDGEIEFTYQIGNRSKIAYLSGKRSPNEYADLWVNILQPLLDCSDWFMSPYSFVLNSEHLYCNKGGNEVSFVYIPSVRASSDYDALKEMVMEIVKQNQVTDINLENKVLWAVQDFNISEFLQMVRPYGLQGIKKAGSQQAPGPVQAPIQPVQPVQPVELTPKQFNSSPISEPKPNRNEIPSGVPNRLDDIAINFPSDGKVGKQEKPRGGIFGSKKEKEVKPKVETKTKSGFWRRKKGQQQEIIQGAAAVPSQPDPVYAQPVVPVYTPAIDDDVTQLDMDESSGPNFRYVGNGQHPQVIDIDIAENEIFTIGRFDASVGVKQSNFEFDKKTKAVTRRHAAVERSVDGYSIVDLSSSAGTFLNGQKLPPNAPFKLESGNRVSFGNAGADYLWEG